MSAFVVYALRDADRNVLYVGQTGDLTRRLRAHRARSSWFPAVASFEVVSTAPDRRTALYEERRLIGALSPRHNVQVPLEATTRRLQDPTARLGSRLEAVGHEVWCDCSWCETRRKATA